MVVRKFLMRKLIVYGVAQAVCVAIMALVFGLLGYYDWTVLVGGIAGALLAMANFFFMAIAADDAADRAVQQDVAGGTKRMRASYASRLVIIFVILIVLAKLGWANPIAMIVPFFIMRPLLMVDGFLMKTGGKKE
jgi:hypothetical protein